VQVHHLADVFVIVMTTTITLSVGAALAGSKKIQM